MRGPLLFALCTLACTASSARDLTPEDLLRLKSYGQTAIVPGQRLLIVERRQPYSEAVDFGYDTYFNSRILTRIRERNPFLAATASAASDEITFLSSSGSSEM